MAKHGTFIYVFKQREITRAVLAEYQFSEPTLNTGVCLSCCAYYLIQSLVKNADYWSWLADIDSKWNLIAQYLNEDYSLMKPIESQERIQKMIVSSGLKHSGTKVIKKGTLNFNSLATSLLQDSNKVHLGRLCILMKTNGPAHAIAISKKYSKPRLMDPNFGEISFNSATDLSNWMNDVFSKRYGIFDHAHINYYDV